MTGLVVIVPSRHRPAAAVELAKAFRETCTAGTVLLFVVDEDDPTRERYLKAAAEYPNTLIMECLAPSTMVKALNFAATGQSNEYFALGFMGDDHRPRTAGWDRLYVDALRALGTGIVYGDDLLQHDRIPTQVAMTSDIVRALGHMAPPPLTHLFVDNYWRDLGENTDCLRYLPEVVVEHMHPIAGKADWDAGHVRVNQQSMYQRDAEAYGKYMTAHFAGDVAKVMALRSAS